MTPDLSSLEPPPQPPNPALAAAAEGAYEETFAACRDELRNVCASRRIGAVFAQALGCSTFALVVWTSSSSSASVPDFSPAAISIGAAKGFLFGVALVVLYCAIAFWREQNAQVNHIQGRIYSANRLKVAIKAAAAIQDETALRKIITDLMALDPYPKSKSGEHLELTRARHARRKAGSVLAQAVKGAFKRTGTRG